MPAEEVIRGLANFIICSFAGWAVECCYAILTTRRWINRGFLSGPFLLMYGAGGMLLFFTLLLIPKEFAEHAPVVFFLALILFSLLEYLASWLLESLSGMRWWDYSHFKANFHGRVCLIKSIYWGTFGVLIGKGLQPYVVQCLMIINARWVIAAAAFYFAFLAADINESFRQARLFSRSMQKLERLIRPTARLIRKKQREYNIILDGYQEKQERCKEEWRGKVKQANHMLQQNPGCGHDAYPMQMERVNEELRLSLRVWKENMKEAAEERDAVIQRYYADLLESLNKALNGIQGTKEYKILYRLANAFPGIMPAPFRVEPSLEGAVAAQRKAGAQSGESDRSVYRDLVLFLWQGVKSAMHPEKTTERKRGAQTSL